MRLRTFTAPDMQRAMVMIRETMGDDAVIISSTRVTGGKSVSVTAALEDTTEFMEEGEYIAEAEQSAEEENLLQEEVTFPSGGLGQYLAATAKSKQLAQTALANTMSGAVVSKAVKSPIMSHNAIIKNPELAYILNELEQVLTFHSLPQDLMSDILHTAKTLDAQHLRTEDGIHNALMHILKERYQFNPIKLEEKPFGKAERVMLVGPPGVGKTLAVAKLVANMVADELPVHVVTTDNKRAGGVEQLRAFTHIMGIETDLASSRGELRKLLSECPASAPMVIDSFGTNPYSYDELKELTDFANLHEIEPVLVLAAGGDAQEAADIAKAFCFLGIKRLLVSRIDTARRMGAILSAAELCQLQLCNLTTNAQVAGGLSEFSAETLTNVLMQHKRDH
ncbi:MAG: hypothetical protein MK052_08210 [Alphaproteobacteria bacterium]|nr:hypothetical protein [Alphaproteobacteria bacterium]